MRSWIVFLLSNPRVLAAVRLRLGVLGVCCAVLLILPYLFSGEVIAKDSHLVAGSEDSRYFVYLSLVFATIGRTAKIFGLCFLGSFLFVSALVMSKARVSQVIEAITGGLRFLPAVAWLPLTVVIVGLANPRAHFLFAALGVCPIMIFHLLHGFRSCPIDKLIVAKLSGASTWRTFWHVVVPNGAPEIFHAVRLGIGFTFVLGIVYEYIFPSIHGVARVVELLEILRYTYIDGALFTALLLFLGLLLDQCVLVARDVWSHQ